jgi:SAM-dependent methyltransferase
MGGFFLRLRRSTWWQRRRNGRLATLARWLLRPLLPGFVDEGRGLVQRPAFERALRKVVADRPPVVVLNAGSGEGLYAPLLLSRPSVRALLELDLGHAAGAAPRRDPRERFVAGSLVALPLRAGSVDLVFCSEVLEHIPDDGRALDELARVLAPGGWFVISVPTIPAEYDPAHVREGYTLESLEALLRARGFLVESHEYCMHAFFRFVLRSSGRGRRLPSVAIRLLACADRVLRLGSPMDLVVAARRAPPREGAGPYFSPATAGSPTTT